MKLLILGSGAMGSLFAGKLKQNGLDVTIFNRENDHIRAIKKSGLKLIDKDGNSSTISIPVTTNPNDLNSDYDLVILLIKAFATETVLKKVLPYLRRNTPILTLQNGIGNMEKIKSIAPTNDVFVGGTWAGAGVVEPGVIFHRAWGSTVIGSAQSEIDSELLTEIASAFSGSGLETQVSEHVQSIIWSKLLVNLAYNGLTAVTRLTNGDAIRTQEGKDIITNLVQEAVQIAEVKEISLLYENPVDECICLGEEEIGMNTSSMLADVLHKRQTEIEAINGAIVEEGKRYAIPTPYNDMILNLVKVIESSYSKIVDKV
jgi:2-dehydropantoate 2-reductase